MLSRGCTCNTARLIPLLVSIVLCCSLLLYLSCSQLQRGSTRMNQTPKALCPPVSDNTLSLFPLFVCLPPTFTQHEYESFPCLQLSTMLHLWAPAHTANTAERNFSLLSGSFIVSNTGSLLSHSSSSFVTSSSTQPPSFTQNWWPHPTPTWQWLHQAAAAAVKATGAKCWWGGQLSPPPCLGHQRETSGRHRPPRRLISPLNLSKCASVNFICQYYQL